MPFLETLSELALTSHCNRRSCVVSVINGSDGLRLSVKCITCLQISPRFKNIDVLAEPPDLLPDQKRLSIGIEGQLLSTMGKRSFNALFYRQGHVHIV